MISKGFSGASLRATAGRLSFSVDRRALRVYLGETSASECWIQDDVRKDVDAGAASGFMTSTDTLKTCCFRCRRRFLRRRSRSPRRSAPQSVLRALEHRACKQLGDSVVLLRLGNDPPRNVAERLTSGRRVSSMTSRRKTAIWKFELLHFATLRLCIDHGLGLERTDRRLSRGDVQRVVAQILLCHTLDVLVGVTLAMWSR